jgi:predicted nucleotidyltransferase component of viral defense system
MTDDYINTVRLLLTIAPVIFKQPNFAIKGGTALNLFVQDMPRLSVDIDVVFTDYRLTREKALDAIAENLRAATDELAGRGYSTQLPKTKDGLELKMVVRDELAQVKVEVNCVFRGTLHEVGPSLLAPTAQEKFTTDVTLPILQTPELYGSKLVAAMDRQHPRDLFDVRLMLDKFGLSADIVSCFVAYLAGHNRPVHEVLFSNPLPEDTLRTTYENEFEGMTMMPVPFEDLVATQKEIHKTLPASLTAAQRRFLLSLVQLEPDWSLMPYPHLKDLPAIQWKLLNLTKLRKSNSQQFEAQFRELNDRFNALSADSNA